MVLGQNSSHFFMASLSHKPSVQVSTMRAYSAVEKWFRSIRHSIGQPLYLGLDSTSLSELLVQYIALPIPKDLLLGLQ
jgi:hypothetical protein